MSRPLKTDSMERVRAAWGEPAPDWVTALATACINETQTAVGRRLGYSGSTVSQVLSNSYPGDLVRFEQMVRGAYLSEAVMCPALNAEIGRDVCQSWQKRPFSTASANAVRMYHACRGGCPHSKLKDLDQ